MRGRWILIALAGLTGLYVLHRTTRTAEYITLFGSANARAGLCRAAGSLNSGRRQWVLERLLDDPDPSVRMAAVAACQRAGADAHLDEKLERMLRDPALAADLRTRAGEALLQRPAVRREVARYLEANAADAAFRRAHPRLVARFVDRQIPGSTDQQRGAWLRGSLDEDDPACEPLRAVILNRIRHFAAFREMFRDALDRGPTFRTRRYLLACLSALGGAESEPAPKQKRPPAREITGTGALIEAEWVQALRPNYQIAEFQGRRCLALGEGAGGYMHWLKGADGTVDIGTARFSLRVPRAGAYQLWARVYLDDKCGNSFGIWIDEKNFANFPDKHNVLDAWHWLPLRHGSEAAIQLAAGRHTGRLQAWEDGVYLDQLALLPEGTHPRGLAGRASVAWDRRLPSTLSVALERQSQSRGTKQSVTIWVRRNDPAIQGGTVRLYVPGPFHVAGPDRKALKFAAGQPLAGARFTVRLPAGSIVGEGLMKAVYTSAGGREVHGQWILGGQFDWLSTGPLAPDNPLNQALRDRTSVSDEDLRRGWSPYPETGFDPYRRLNLEQAYGQLRNRFIYLCCDVEVSREDDYLALLTADDTAHVYIDGKLVIAQPQGGPGEGRLIMEPLHLTPGRRRVFVRLFQADFPDPVGPDSDRQSWNHYVFKLLLRKERHKPAEAIKGLPRPEPARR